LPESVWAETSRGWDGADSGNMSGMSEQTPPPVSTKKLSRTRGAASGILLVLLGAWGALIPFIGPTFNFAYTPDQAWKWTAARGWYEVLPGSVAFVAGLLLLLGTSRASTVLGAWLGIAAGAWFIVGPAISTEITLGSIGRPVGDNAGLRAAEILAFFYGLGAIILFLAASAFGRLSVVTLRDVKVAERREAARLEAEEEARRVEADNAAYRDAGRSRFFDGDRDENDRESVPANAGDGRDTGYAPRGGQTGGEPGYYQGGYSDQNPATQQYGNAESTRQMPPVDGSEGRTAETSPRPTTSGYNSAPGYQQGEQDSQYSSPTYGRHDPNFGQGAAPEDQSTSQRPTPGT
jgi:hypothetical protein